VCKSFEYLVLRKFPSPSAENEKKIEGTKEKLQGQIAIPVL